MTWLGTIALARDGGGFEPRMTRIYTDGEGAGRRLGKPSRRCVSNPFTSELARDCEIASLTRFASGPAFRALREIKKLPRIGTQKKHGARPACRDGRVFEKTSASLIARGFAKKPLHSRS
jgi:hypothetical protein